MRLEQGNVYAFYLHPELNRQRVSDYLCELIGDDIDVNANGSILNTMLLREDECEGVMIEWWDGEDEWNVMWVAVNTYHNGHIEEGYPDVQHIDLRNEHGMTWRRHSMT